MILFCLAFLRIYIIIKLFKYWNLFTNMRSSRISKFFQKGIFAELFFYKSNVKYRGFITMSFLFIVCFYIISLIFQVLEDYTPNLNSGFGFLLNCFWFMIETMTTSNNIFILI